MNRFLKTFLVVTLLLLVCGILVAPVSAATTQVHVVKYASDGTTVLAEQTVNYSWMQANLPVLGDGTTHYYHQGPVFVDDPVEAVEQALRWNPDEDTNVQDKDMGAVKGTDVKDLCNLVGGMSPGDTLRIRASDGMTKDFAYKNVYGYSSREGPIGLTWYTDFDFDPATPGKYPDTGYTDGMRLVWFADDGVNPWGIHAFGNYDWHEAAAPEYWYYYQQGGENYPTTTGLSVKYVSELRIISSAGPVAPVAAFSGIPLSGTAPLTVQFTDASTGTPTSWAWDFTNDGTVDSTLQNPSYTYTGVGTFTVKLTVTNAGGSDDEVKTNYITASAAPVAPVAAFASDVQTGTAPLTVHFTDASTNSPTSWAWDFNNDGTVDSTTQSPSHIYDTAGTYTVNLTVTNAGGSDSEVKTGYITVNPAGPATPVAAFTAAPLTGTAPLTVHFTDASTGTPASWAWDFNNDGTVDSTTQSPSHIYDTVGTYTVKLTVTNAGGSDSEVKTDYISVQSSGGGSITVIFPDDADNSLLQNSPGATGDWNPEFYAFSRSGNMNRRGIIHFNLSSIPLGATVNSANLYLYMASVNGGDQIHDIHRVNAPWTEATVTWATLPAFESIPTANAHTGTVANTWISWDVSSDIQAFMSGTPNYGWLLKHSVESLSPFQYAKYWTKEYTTPALRPYLEVTYTVAPPAPTAAFTSDVQSGPAPLTVHFTDASSGTPTSWAWDFTNDGTVDSAEPSPSHIYDTAGTYTVNLTVTNAGGSDSEVKTDYITVIAAGPKTWYVDDSGGADFTTIQAAVNAATDGDTIIVKDGTYAEYVGVDKSLTIQSQNGRATTTVQSPLPNSNVFTPLVNNVIIDGFTLRSDGTGIGIGVIGVTGCILRNNDVSNNLQGFYVDSANNNIFENNVARNCISGITIANSNGNLVAKNTFSANEVGVELSSSTSNIFYLNNIIGNTQFDVMTDDPPVSGGIWNSPTPVTYSYDGSQYTGYAGNYWGGYSGSDADANGIGDAPFQTLTSPIEFDNYPLMGEWNNGEITYTPPAVISPLAAFTSDVQTGTAPLTVNFTDQSTNTPTSWAWDVNNDGTVDYTTKNATHIFTTAGTYTVNLTVSNAGGNDSEVKTDFITVSPPTPALLWGPYLTGTTTTGTVVNVKTNIATAVSVEYATDAYYTAHSAYDQSATDSVSTQLHHVSLAGLTPDTLYHYRVVYDGQQTGDLHVSTFPASGAFTFVVYSDTQDQLPTFSQLERHKLVADRIAEEPDVAFVLNSGDLVNNAADLNDWNRYFAAGSMMMANTTVYPALGNHDDNDPNYFAAYGVPAYYSFDIADAHVAVLDSNDWAWPQLPTQSAWLANDLQTTKPFKFTSFHHPLYTSDSKHFGGWENLREAWEGDFNDNGVLAVFNGHVHAYERFLVNDTNYFVAGTGGGPAYNLATPRAAGSVNSLEYALAYTKVTVDPAAGTATAQVIRVADVSTDLKTLTTIYPAGTVFETVVMTIAEPPAANFTAEPEAGLMPLTVQFTDTTSGTAPFTYAWNFGDGGTSTGQSPSHTYATYGTYTVTLTATNSAGADTETKESFITVNQPPPDAVFTADPLSGTVPVTVTFTDASANADAWTWDFGDGATSVEPNPSHTYTAAGTYTVNLTVTNTAGSATQFTTVTVLPPLPVADFTATPASGVAPLIVKFTDASSDAATWSWAFGDGTTSTSQNPSHTYTTAGTYTATLTVTNAAGTAGKDTQIVVATPPPVADFTATPTSGTVPLSVQFTDASTGATSRSWAFGDGSTSTLQSPSHTYTSVGTYTATLTVTNAGGSKSKEITITVREKIPVARFTQDKYSGKIPLAVQFTDRSQNNPATYLWRFGDGSTSTLKNPSHTYTQPGVYVVRLTATNSAGSDSATSFAIALPRWWFW